MKIITALLLLALSGCSTFEGFKGSTSIEHKSGWNVTVGYSK